MCLRLTAARSSQAAASGFSSVSSRGSGAGPPQLAGLFSGGMPQLRSRGVSSGGQNDSGSSTAPRPGLRRHVILTNSVYNVYQTLLFTSDFVA